MIRMDDLRIRNEEIRESGSLYTSLLFLLNQRTGLKLNPAKIDIYYQQLKSVGSISVGGLVDIEKLLEFFKITATIKNEVPSYKPKKNEMILINYEDEKTSKNQYVVGVGNVVCYNPLGNILKGKPAEAIVIKFK